MGTRSHGIVQPAGLALATLIGTMRTGPPSAATRPRATACLANAVSAHRTQPCNLLVWQLSSHSKRLLKHGSPPTWKEASLDMDDCDISDDCWSH